MSNNIIIKDYPYWPPKTLEDVIEQLRLICNLRKNDKAQISNIANAFVSGRKVGRSPTSSADVLISDKIGDVNYDVNYLYILVDDGMSGAWRRAALGAW